MEYGLIAALGWGVSSIAATHAARRMGTSVIVLLAALICKHKRPEGGWRAAA